MDLFDKTPIVIDMNRLEFGEVDSIKLPSPIKAPFSQGERQVYIMSIYLALLETSHKDIPFFIDTPFARIDSEHRANIVTEFFTKISNQNIPQEERLKQLNNMARSQLRVLQQSNSKLLTDGRKDD